MTIHATHNVRNNRDSMPKVVGPVPETLEWQPTLSMLLSAPAGEQPNAKWQGYILPHRRCNCVCNGLNQKVHSDCGTHAHHSCCHALVDDGSRYAPCHQCIPGTAFVTRNPAQAQIACAALAKQSHEPTQSWKPVRTCGHDNSWLLHNCSGEHSSTRWGKGSHLSHVLQVMQVPLGFCTPSEAAWVGHL